MASRNDLMIKKQHLLKEYRMIKHKLEVYQKREELVKRELDSINGDICNLSGHVVSNETLFLTKAYGFVFTCINCGKIISEDDLTDKDTVIIKNNNHKKIKYKNY